jgi:hypothetical protein
MVRLPLAVVLADGEAVSGARAEQLLQFDDGSFDGGDARGRGHGGQPPTLFPTIPLNRRSGAQEYFGFLRIESPDLLTSC